MEEEVLPCKCPIPLLFNESVTVLLSGVAVSSTKITFPFSLFLPHDISFHIQFYGCLSSPLSVWKEMINWLFFIIFSIPLSKIKQQLNL